MMKTGEKMRRYKSVEVAAKWWGDYLDGTRKERTVEESNPDLFDALEQYSERMSKVFKNVADYLDNKLEETRSQAFVTPHERRKFEVFLAKLMQKEVEERGCCYLCTDEYGVPAVPLSLAAYYADIPRDEKSAFPMGIGMFVLKDKVEVRYELEDDRKLYTIYEGRENDTPEKK